MLPVTHYTRPPAGPSRWPFLALGLTSAIALACLGYLSWGEYQRQVVEQYICIPELGSENCQVARPRWVPRYLRGQ